jgi:hypothetical protein
MSYGLLPDHLSTYLDGIVPTRPPEMQAMEAYAQKIDFPIIGPASGHLCYQLARLAPGAFSSWDQVSGIHPPDDYRSHLDHDDRAHPGWRPGGL